MKNFDYIHEPFQVLRQLVKPFATIHLLFLTSFIIYYVFF